MALRVGDGVPGRGNSGAQAAFGAIARPVVAQQGQDQRVAEESDFGTPRLVRRCPNCGEGGSRACCGLRVIGLGHREPPTEYVEASVPEAMDRDHP
jgi:hypothetical protein